MKILHTTFRIITISCILSSNLFSGFAGRAATQQSEAEQTQVYTGLKANLGAAATGSGQGQVCCSAGQTCQTPQVSTYIPQFNIEILGASGNAPNFSSPLNTANGATMLDTNFTYFAYANCMLTVHIFPPSNMISGSTVTTSKNDDYVAFYTLKNFAGDTVYKTFQIFKSGSFPHYIAISGPMSQPSNQQQESSNPAIFNADSRYSNYACVGTLFPPNVAPTNADKQKLMNGLSPIVQTFLFVNNGTDITVSHVSGAFTSETNSYMQSTKGSFYSAASATAGSDALQPLNISFNDDGQSITPIITFNLPDTNPTIPFTAADLAAGLILDVVILPATYNGQTASGSYSVVATIRTIDGTKLRKKYSINPSTYNTKTQTSGLGSSLPYSITLSQGDPSSASVILISNILSSQQTGNTPFINIISPLNLKFIISQPKSSKIQVLML